MARTVNFIERISDDFDSLDGSMTRADVVFELFTRLEDLAKQEALRRITTHAKMAGMMRPDGRRRSEVPPLMEREEVEAAGKLALSPVPEVKQ